MNQLFFKKLRLLVLLLFVVFLLFFVFRLGYGYTLDVETESKGEVYFDYFESGKDNYASNDFKKGRGKMDMDKGFMDDQVGFDPITATDQKYEKIAEVKTETHQFDTDEAFVREQVDTLGGIIQFEKKYGNEGERRLQLQVGIPPDNFDTLYSILIAIGITHSKQIIKNDKTNDFLELNARKASLENTHKSLVEFKEKGGKIDEYVNLENRILEIEKELQNLGVNLGEFDKSNEFCTVKFAMSEGKPAVKKTVSFYHRCKVALEWTLGWFLRFISITFFAILTASLLVYLGDKKEIIKKALKKIRRPFGDKKDQ